MLSLLFHMGKSPFSLSMIPALRRADVVVREGRFQRWLALVAASAGALSGLEVSYEHYKGSYSRRIMYTPVILSGALGVAGLAAFFSRRAAVTFLRATAIVTLADSTLGFYFHIRGVARKPGGWKLPITNIVMGPPIFAPLLFGTAAYLALLASYLRRDGAVDDLLLPRPTHPTHWAARLGLSHERISWEQDVREGRFQNQLAIATAVSAFFSGFEAWYSHYKNNFRYGVQWTPIVVAPLLMSAAIGSLKEQRLAHTALPAVSALAMLNGGVGFFYHARGVLRRPGGLKKPLYNLMYGPPIFAPLLFAAAGFLGVLASLLRREKRS